MELAARVLPRITPQTWVEEVLSVTPVYLGVPQSTPVYPGVPRSAPAWAGGGT